MSEPTLRVLSFGGGVQTTVLSLMTCDGEIEKPDVAIMGDTAWERRKTYEHIAWLREIMDANGIPLHVVRKGNLREDSLRCVDGGRANGGERFASLPLFTRGPNGEFGMIRRQCTKEYKIDVVRRAIRDMLNLPPGVRVPSGTLVEQWFGISTDETRRMRLSQDWWIRHRYPLVFDRPMSRAGCLAWFAQRYPGRELPRSACVGCPFHSNSEWRQLRDESPDEWADAVDYDQRIRRQIGLDGQAFLHVSRRPLDQAPLGDPDPNQGSLFGNECLGMCGV